MRLSRLWAVTSFFNPAKFRRKLPNYRMFRNRLAVPLVTVELSHGDTFELGPGDADILVQLRGGDVMWQKERLLNIAISHLPNECDYVAWLDCDVVFSRSDWAYAAILELDRASMCQLYRSVYHMARDAAISRETALFCSDSLGYAIASGLLSPADSFSYGVAENGGTNSSSTSLKFKRGHAWCAHRDLLATHGLYDRNVVGGGDSLLAHAAARLEEDVIARHGMTPYHADDYRQWVARFSQQMRGIGYIEGDLFHLWHGDLERRRYRERLQILSSSG